MMAYLNAFYLDNSIWFMKQPYEAIERHYLPIF